MVKLTFLSVFIICCLPLVLSYRKQERSHALNDSFIQVWNEVPFAMNLKSEAEGGRPYPNILAAIGATLHSQKLLEKAEVVKFDQKPYFDYLEANFKYKCMDYAKTGACYGVAWAYLEWKASSGRSGKSTADFITALTTIAGGSEAWSKKVCQTYSLNQGTHSLAGYDQQHKFKARDTPLKPKEGAVDLCTYYEEEWVTPTAWLVHPATASGVTPAINNKTWEWDFKALLEYFPSPSLSIFYCEDGQHTFGILKTRTRYRFIDANAGILSCTNLDQLLEGIHEYLRDATMFKKYTAHGKQGGKTVPNVVLDIFWQETWSRHGATGNALREAGYAAARLSQADCKKMKMPDPYVGQGIVL